MIDEIVAKRTKLMNFFRNEDVYYTKEEILNKEFAVLSFSPNEEYIDSIHSQYDDLCVDLTTFDFGDCDEIYIKGIIVDVDRQKNKVILHLQNKETIVSIFCFGATLEKYDSFFIVGEPVIAKCSIYAERLSLGFLVNLNQQDKFKNECKYMSGMSFETIRSIMSDRDDSQIHYGVIVQCRQTKTKKNKDMIIGSLYDGANIRGFATVKTHFNPIIPTAATAGSFVRFKKPTMDFLLNDVEVISL